MSEQGPSLHICLKGQLLTNICQRVGRVGKREGERERERERESEGQRGKERESERERE